LQTLNCKGRLITLSQPKVMGILNITPDSFYDGGVLSSHKEILAQAETMLNEGASFLDIGGYSSRPGSAEVTEEEELQRVIPAIEAILHRFPEALLSIDTFRSKIVTNAIAAGAAIINDISAGDLDDQMMQTVAQLQVPFIMMHMKGTPQNMTTLAQYENITQEVLFYFSEKIRKVRELGIHDVIVDPGFGFAKDTAQNFELLQHLALFDSLNAPLLVGVSRKSMIYKTLETNAQEALNGTTALHSVALLKGAKILRVHDVKEAMECVRLLQMLPTDDT